MTVWRSPLAKKLFPVTGFAPDLDPTTPGVVTSCQGMLPTLVGMEASPSPVSAGFPALADECTGAFAVTLLDGSSRFFAATATAIYEGISSAWTDQSRLVGGAYNAATSRWRGTQFGNVTILGTKLDTLQYSNTSGAFANIAGAPKANVIETVGDFVMVADYDDGTDTPNGIFWSGRGDYTDWTPAAATECGNLSLTSTPGSIRALRRLGDNVVAYKGRSMYLGTFQPQILWGFQEISGTVGAVSHEAVVPIVTKAGGAAHIFMASDDFYYFDGSRPVPIGSPVKTWFFERLNDNFSDKVAALHDPVKSLIYWFYPSTSSMDGSLNACIVYNYRADKWGVDDRDIELPILYISGGLTYGDFEGAYHTYADIPAIPYDSAYWYEGSRLAAYFDTSHVLQSLAGESLSSSFTTGDLGDDEQVLCTSRARPRYQVAPDSGTLTNYYRMNLGDTLTTGATTTFTNGKYDFMRSARWHRLKFDHTGDTELTAISVEYTLDGDE